MRLENGLCHWCNGTNGRHELRCNVPSFTLTISTHKDAPVIPLDKTQCVGESFLIPRTEPTSLEMYDAAVTAGKTIGHEWLNR